ncbi:MAG: hypothetical protein KKD18_03500, partial [Nanoarchaeota archaeon]|nr:hypothetical protein [Nanoarchaeota archaeon]
IMVGFVFVMSAQLRNISGLLAEKFDPINNKLTSEREKGIKRTFIGVLDDAIESCLDVLLIVSIIFNVPFVWLYIAGAYSVFCWIYGFIKTDFRFRKTYGY